MYIVVYTPGPSYRFLHDVVSKQKNKLNYPDPSSTVFPVTPQILERLGITVGKVSTPHLAGSQEHHLLNGHNANFTETY